jgi:predicted MPP superfamily phosphohydrolase
MKLNFINNLLDFLKIKRNYHCVVFIFDNNDYLRYSISNVKFNKRYLEKKYKSNKYNDIKFSYFSYYSMYEKFETENLYIFSYSYFDAFSNYSIKTHYCLIFDNINKNIEKDLYKFLKNFEYDKKFVSDFVKIFKLKNYPEYII